MIRHEYGRIGETMYEETLENSLARVTRSLPPVTAEWIHVFS